jgi:hypothetical protein
MTLARRGAPETNDISPKTSPAWMRATVRAGAPSSPRRRTTSTAPRRRM